MISMISKRREDETLSDRLLACRLLPSGVCLKRNPERRHSRFHQNSRADDRQVDAVGAKTAVLSQACSVAKKII